MKFATRRTLTVHIKDMELAKYKRYGLDTRLPKTCEEVVLKTLSQLGHCYDAAVKDGDFQTFLNDFYDVLDRDDSVTGVKIIKGFLKSIQDDASELNIAKKSLLASIHLSLYFCYLANLAYAADSFDQAWFFTTKANMWLGVAYGVDHSIEIFRDELYVLAKAGARGRNEKYQPLRDFVRQEVAKKNYRSARNAALSLKEEVLALANELGIGLSEQQAEKTIAGWLRGIPFASKRVR